MEPSFILYIKNLLITLTLVLVWMTVNIKFGIMNNYAFFEEKINTENIIFYAWFLLSLGLIIAYLIKLWNKPLEQKKD